MLLGLTCPRHWASHQVTQDACEDMLETNARISLSAICGIKLAKVPTYVRAIPPGTVFRDLRLVSECSSG